MLCNLCPRKCNVDRKNHFGSCMMGPDMAVAKIMIHEWEEPFVSGIEYGKKGTGAIFFYGCNLNCIYCQNYKISNLYKTKVLDNIKYSNIERLDIILENKKKEAENNAYQIYTPTKLAKEMIRLENEGVHTISFITGTIYIDKIKKTIEIARSYGLKIPIVYNTSGYENVESLKMLNGLIDIYLPDFKYYKNYLGDIYSNVKDYVEVTKDAINEMYKQVGPFELNEDGSMRRGVIVRHLMLPREKENAKEIIKYLYDTYKDTIYLSIMNQYTPTKNVMLNSKRSPLTMKVGKRSYDEVVKYMIDLGVENAFTQEDGTASESFIPEFQ